MARIYGPGGVAAAAQAAGITVVRAREVLASIPREQLRGMGAWLRQDAPADGVTIGEFRDAWSSLAGLTLAEVEFVARLVASRVGGEVE